jgi:hypothetical protein
MLTLVINAPKAKAQEENKRSFKSTFQSRVGDEYAIWSHWVPLLGPGCRVVLLSKDEELRAEGELVELVRKSKTGSGIQRYDVHIKNLKMSRTKLNVSTGTASQLSK